LDSKFPLAFRRASQVMGWQRSGTDSGYALALHAGALNHGLAPRDSLLLTTDSLFASVYSTVPRVDWSAVRRVHAIAQELTRRYPDDFESWYALGEARYHIGSPVGTTTRQALEAFDRAIESDSSFGPAYIHAVELAGRLDGLEAASRHAKGYLRLRPTDASASGLGLAGRIIEALRTRPAEIAGLLQDAAPSALDDAFPAVRMLADSTEAAIAVARALVAAPPGDEPWLTRADRERRLGTSLLHRGHVRDAVRILFQNQTTIPPILVEAALLSRALPDSVPRIFHSWLLAQPIARSAIPLAWWTAQRDSASIRELERRSHSLARSAQDAVDRNTAAYASQAAPAYLALVRYDTTAAIRRLEALPDSLCAVCYFERLTLAQLLSARHEDAKAARLLERQLTDVYGPSEVLWTLERARVTERLGDREKASRDYQYVANVWRHADPELQPYVTEAKEGLTRVVGEPR
jgi:tetratricopeptide (TPR) repeat protein